MMTQKSLAIVLALLLIVSSLAGCVSPKYRGENPELYTVAIYSFFGAAGYASNGEITFPSETEIIERDSYGRVLFYYHEGTIDTGCGYGILQKVEDGYAYYYEDDCVICVVDDWRGSGEITHDDWFSEEELSAFKALNDWEQPFSEDKCTKKPIVSRKPEEKLNLKKNDLDKTAKAYLTNNGYQCSEKRVYLYYRFFMRDDYGREMYYVLCNGYRIQPTPGDIVLAIIFNPDGSCDASTGAIWIEDMQNYGEVLKTFKQNNGWNTKYEP